MSVSSSFLFCFSIPTPTQDYAVHKRFEGKLNFRAGQDRRPSFNEARQCSRRGLQLAGVLPGPAEVFLALEQTPLGVQGRRPVVVLALVRQLGGGKSFAREEIRQSRQDGCFHI